MSISRIPLGLVFLLLGQLPAWTGELPATIKSAPCRTAPTIDGLLDDREWKDAPVLEFDLKLIQLKPPAASTRSAQLRVMNSANALYIALRVPDETVNSSFAPLDVDAVILAFCRGKEVAAGDDRKVIGGGLYRDKHVTGPGKDVDDKQQDGRGAMTHDKGVYTFECAIPLDSGDKEDTQTKPGDKLRFNLGYFDGLRAELKETHFGVAYGKNLDRVEGWGTLQLAADVKDDGGTAFKGPAWVADVFKRFRDVPANRLRLLDSALVPGQLTPAAKAVAEFKYRDAKGKEKTGKAKLYMPASVREASSRVPLFFAAGYEIDDAMAAAHVRRGFAVMTPSALESNPLVRTSSPDIALLHIARSLPFVDDTRVVIGGGSAGGYMTLMLAAETFPLAAALPDLPPVNWGYNAAYFLHRKKVTAGKKPPVPVLDLVVPIAEQGVPLYGADTDDATWYRHSPLAHLSTITCPVSVYWSTADVLVPIDQVAAKWVQPFDDKAFPEGFTMDPEKLMKLREGRMRLLDVLPETAFEAFVIKQETLEKWAKPDAPKIARELSFSKTKQWSIVILDEGKPEAKVGHVKYTLAWSRNDFLKQVVTGNVHSRQLTQAKLERLMDRYAGKEWLPTPLTHLDYPESERADVVRGLKVYVAAGVENAQRFDALYRSLPRGKQVLEAEVLKAICGN